MNGLLERFTNRLAAKARNAQDRYREILNRAGDPQRGDDEQLAKLAEEIGLGAAEVSEDFAAAKAMAAAQGAIVPADEQAKLAEASTRAAQAVTDFEAEVLLKREALRRDEFATLNAERQAGARTREARARIAELRSAHPRLFNPAPVEPVKPYRPPEGLPSSSTAPTGELPNIVLGMPRYHATVNR